METKNKLQTHKDLANNRIHLSREFKAPLKTVWTFYTESNLLDQWWAPKPWKSETKTMKFEEGGFWLYAMVGPDGSKHWGKMDYKEIKPFQNFAGEDAFCDENGNLNRELPITRWNTVFSESVNGTIVENNLQFESKQDLEKLLEMGFEEGISLATDGLEELLSKVE